MSTQFTFKDSDMTFATRSNGMLQLEFTEHEAKGIEVNEELDGDNGWRGTIEDLLVEMENDGTKVVWDSAARRNEIARGLENHRFINDPGVGPALQARAAEMRMAAKHAAKEGLSLV
ncbi:MAG: hypothetical protein VX428_07705 [Verrucomicrobiota bacterium]|nr:hypothetical protein [Verrucomicrobiota bacterium]